MKTTSIADDTIVYDGDPKWLGRHERLMQELVELDIGHVEAFFVVTSGIDWHHGVEDRHIVRAGLHGFNDVAAAMAAGLIPRAPHSALYWERVHNVWETIS